MALEKVREALEAGQPHHALKPAIELLDAGLPAAQESATRLGETLRDLWHAFHVAAVVRLFELLRDEGIPDESLNEVRKPLKREFELAQSWAKALTATKRARLLSTMRDALREHRPKDAVEAALAFADLGKVEQVLPAIGSVLGTVDSEIAAAHKVAQTVGGKLNLDAAAVDVMHDAIEQRHKSIFAGHSENREREFLVDHINATVELAKSLPSVVEKGKEKEAEAAQRFGEQVRAILAVGERFADRDHWPDIARLLAEFLPHELSATGKRAGVEQRQYQSLTMGARKVCAQAFKEVGQSETIVRRFLGLAETALAEGRPDAVHFVELLGAFRNAKANAFMMKALAGAKDSPALQSAAVDALGNLGNDKSVEVLFNHLRGCFKGKTLDAPARRRAARTIGALGRVARNPAIDDSIRTRVMQMVRQAIPMEEHGLQSTCVMEILTPRSIEKADPGTRAWAAKILTEELWTPEQHMAFESVEPGAKPHVLGGRAKAGELLAALAPSDARTIIATAEPKSLQFSGAFMALGEVFAKAPTIAALPLLERMIDAAAQYTPGALRGEYGTEQMWDVATEQFVTLDKTPVLESLLYAVIKTVEKENKENGGAGGPATESLRTLFDRVKRGDIAGIGTDASKLLYDAHRRFCEKGGAAPRTRARDLADEERTKIEQGQQDDFGSTELLPAIDPEPGQGGALGTLSLTLVDKIALLKQLKKGGLFAGPRRTRKVVAMQRLAGAGDVDALPIILEQLGDKDSLVAAAAGTALIEYTRPPQSAKTTEMAVTEMAELLMQSDRKRQIALRKAMAQMNLMREPCRKAIARKLSGAGGAGLAYELSQIMGLSSPELVIQRFTGTGSKATGPKSAAPGVPEEEAADGGPPSVKGRAVAGGAASPAEAPRAPAGSSVSALEEKRRVLEARRAWIAGGKKGPEPK